MKSKMALKEFTHPEQRKLTKESQWPIITEATAL